MASRNLKLAVGLTAGAALLTACGSVAQDQATGTVHVVASTNVYGDIAQTIGGGQVTVTSLLSSPDQDPHSFEANPRTALAVSQADLLIENGGGYDDYMQRLQKAGNSNAPVINVVDLSGKKASVGNLLNEHVWYDLPTVKKFADDLATRLGQQDSAHAVLFEDRARQFTTKISALAGREAALRTSYHGTPIGITEPVPLYLTAACGLVNKTPPHFSAAIEEGNDVSAPVLQQTLNLYRDRKVRALFYNVQTGGPMTDEVKAAAKDAGIAVVPVTETLPTGKDYLDWMADNITALAAAVTK
jgi:zinc/manganese transport system substrate-binding protein